MRFVLASVMLFFVWAKPAAADLYRWVDPETGSVKFSSYPPPWYKDAAKQRRAPRVEHIPAGKAPPQKVEEADKAQPPAKSAPAAQAGKVPEELESRRKAMLQQMSALAALSGPERGPTLTKQIEVFAALSDQIDKIDPNGAAARQAEAQALIEKIAKGGPR